MPMKTPIIAGGLDGLMAFAMVGDMKEQLRGDRLGCNMDTIFGEPNDGEATSSRDERGHYDRNAQRRHIH